MKRLKSAGTVGVWFLRLLIVLGVLAVATLEPLNALNNTTDTARVSSYAVKMDLLDDGTLWSDEVIDVEMPGGKRGIFRIFDTADPRRTGVDHPVSDVVVTRDGQTEPWVFQESAEGTRTIRIGSEDVYLAPGTHRYVIRSMTTDVLEPGEDPDETVWWWDVVGSGWQMDMDRVEVSAMLPADPIRAECVQGEDTPCTASVEGRSLRISTGPLAPFTPVTVRVAFAADSLPAPPAGGTSWTTLWSILAGIMAAAVGFALLAATRERRPGFPVLFEPPQGMSPALGARVVNEDDSDDDLQATLYDLGERGVVRLDGDDDSWRIHLLGVPSTATLNSGESAVLAALGLATPGDSFLVSKSKTAGERVMKAQEALRKQVDLDSAPYLHTSPPGMWAKGLGWLSIIGVAAMVGIYFFSDSGWHRWPLLIGAAVFAVVILGVVLDPATRTKHTAEGRDVWSRAGGFARFLTTDSAESRFDAAAHMDWFPRYLSWALVFGSADAWARRYEAQGVGVPVVPWLFWSGSPGSRFTTSSMSDSFNSAITAASATYAASQSSSGGGGGFSGGSGGGGGGGGSW